PLDLTGEVAHGQAVRAEPDLTRSASHQGGLLLHELRDLPAHHLGPEVAELSQRSGVEGARLHALGAEGSEALSHLTCRASGERDRQHRLRVVRVHTYAVGNA